MSKKLKIGISGRVLLPGILEGIPRYIFETTKRMILAHPEHEFYIYFDRDFDEKFVFAKNVKPKIVRPQARHPWLWKIWYEWSLPRAMKRDGIDVFYSGESFLSLRSKVPTLMVIHDLAFEAFPDHLPAVQQKYLQNNVPKFHKRADHIVAVSEFTKKHIIKNYNISPDKISVAGNAAPEGFEILTSQSKEQVRESYAGGCRYLLYLGSLHPRKNIKKLIEAFQIFKHSKGTDHKLLLIGRLAWNSGDIETAINDSADVIHLTGIGDEVKQIMAAADMLVYVSLFEGFGIPVLEAFSCGVPVVCSKDSSMSEVGGNGVHQVDPNEADDIAKGISKVYHNEDYRSQLIREGQDRLAFFDWNTTANHVFEELNRLVKS